MNLRRQRYATVWLWRPGASWPMYGATPERTQAPRWIRLRPPLRQVYAVKTDGLVELPPVTSGGIGYFTSAHGTLTAFDTQTGRVRWRHHLRAVMAASPAVVGNVLVVVGLDGFLHGFDLPSGRPRYRRPLGGPSESSPLVLPGGRIAVATWNGRIMVLDARSGRARWSRSLGSKITSAPARSGSDLVVGTYGGRVAALAIRSGRVRWSTGLPGRIYAAPAVWGGRVFVTSSTGRLRRRTVGPQRPAAVAPLPRELRVRRPGRRRRHRGDRVVQRAARRAARLERADGLDGAHARCDLGRAADRRRHGLVGLVRRRDRGPLAGARERLQTFRHGRYVPISGDARTLLLVGYQRVWGLRPKLHHSSH